MAPSPLRLLLNGKADRAPVDAAIGAVRQLGIRVDVAASEAPGDLARLTREALRDARRGRLATIVAGGGDGTVNEVFGAAFLEGVPDGCSLAILPLGTANDFANAAGLPVADLAACLELAAAGPTARIDLGLLDGRPFVNLLSGGFGSRVTAETDPELKARLGGVAYLLAGLSRLGDLAASRGRVTGEDFVWEGSFISLAIGNGRTAGGGIPLCPDALIDDGQLDLMILPELLAPEGPGLAALLPGVGPGDSPLLRKARGRWFEYASDEPLHINLDGEPLQSRHFRVECRPAALPVRLGPSPLLRR